MLCYLKEVKNFLEAITVEIYGDENDEHSTYIKRNDKYMRFYTDGYEGTSAKQIVNLLKFIGHEVFVVNHNSNDILTENYCNADEFI